MAENYLTIKEVGSSTLIIKKSEFICYLARTNTEEEARDFLAFITNEHRKANHHCFAYTLGLNDEIQRESDNGEPSGTAGVPILEVLKNNQLHNVTAVVVRYFGGIKLGTGGLIRAYSSAVSQAIQEIGIVKRVLQTEITCSIDYPLLGKLQNYLENQDYYTVDTQYTEQVAVTVAVDTEKVDPFQAEIFNLLNAQVTFTIGNNVYHEIPVKI
ncbi:YigZ family protein [Ligilactobacillus ceti]|uniref:YigZ family protein n=1 Tax=Ligilactobacillus ceti DSM 22408 TaxID=1122146 RepID=A0A0R2KKA4_9LACO|nr:YigZ family protein [Ligilactobacillus ceti]KRN89800.1 hypothetical protein IV53_GL001127 [Ligilactobacillus ceti DSM 22408]